MTHPKPTPLDHLLWAREWAYRHERTLDRTLEELVKAAESGADLIDLHAPRERDAA